MRMGKLMYNPKIMHGNKFWVWLLLGIGVFVASVSLLVYLFPYQATAEWFYVAGLFVSVVGIALLGLLLAYWRMASLLSQTKIDPFWLGIGWIIVSALLLISLFPYDRKAAWFRTAGLFVGGVGVAPLGLFLAYRRTEALWSQTRNEIRRRVTDSLTQAVDLLGHSEIAVRQGGIYALGRIAAENRVEHPKIMSIIAAYIRHRSRAYVEEEHNKKENKSLPWDEFINNYISKRSSPIDLEAAVAVICGRNSAFDIPPANDASFLNLSGVFLFRINFTGASLEQVDFTGSILRNCIFQKAKLNDAIMHGANFTSSIFYGADMSEVQARGAIFSLAAMDKAKMCDADLTAANFQRANLSGVDFSYADLSEAEFQHADLISVNFNNAHMGGIKFEKAFAGASVGGAKLDNAVVIGADFRGEQPFTEEQVRGALGNWGTKLPMGWTWPEDWQKDDPDKGES